MYSNNYINFFQILLKNIIFFMFNNSKTVGYKNTNSFATSDVHRKTLINKNKA